MKSILNIENNREKCQKFTPLNIVDDMLDMAEYTTNLMGKKVLENSFGSGHILKSIGGVIWSITRKPYILIFRCCSGFSGNGHVTEVNGSTSTFGYYIDHSIG